MDFPFRSQFSSTHWSFVMTFEPQNIIAIYDGDTSSLNMQATFKRLVVDHNQQQDFYPVILDLHGTLYRMNYPNENSVSLRPIVDMPISLIHPDISYNANLSFAFPKHYIQFLEEWRASQQAQDMLLQIQMWGVVAIAKHSNNNTEGMPSYLQERSLDVVRFENVRTDHNSIQPIRIARSDWIDRVLPGLGYRRSMLIELPLIRTLTIPEAYLKAAESLDMARRAFEQEDYRGSVKHGREVLEHLGNCGTAKTITSFCKEALEPIIGETKSTAIDGSLNILRRITSASSHGNNFIVDRALASYVIETLALNLRYISAALG